WSLLEFSPVLFCLWCRRWTAAEGGSNRFVANVFFSFLSQPDVPDRTGKHTDLDGQQPPLHPPTVRAAGIRQPGRRVDRGVGREASAGGTDAAQAATRPAAAVLPERVPRLRRLRLAGSERPSALEAAHLFIARNPSRVRCRRS